MNVCKYHTNVFRIVGIGKLCRGLRSSRVEVLMITTYIKVPWKSC